MSQRPLGLFLRSFADNILAALCMLVGLRRAFSHLHPAPVQFLFFLTGSLLTSLTFDLVSEGLPGSPDPVGFAVFLLPPFFWMIFGVFLAQRYGVWRLVLGPVILWLAADILVGLVQSGIQWAGQEELLPVWLGDWIPNAYLALFAWPTASLVVIFGRQLAWSWWLRIVVMAAALAFLYGWSYLFADQRLWYAQTEVGEAAPPRITEEAAYYMQPLLLNRALARVEPGTPGHVDWYFLGIGGAAYQSVFRRETESVQSLFDTRFDTQGHSLVLINDDDTALTQPIATRTSITRALETLGKRMNADEDVLFLFMTSHGSPDGLFELSHQPLQLQGITPAWLRLALDNAGIRWRVIVLSSCYSGAFIPALRSSESLVITAAAADKTSFGCTDDADFTYFGRAFFDESLRQDHSLLEAFASARKSISQREKEEGFQPSEPQLFMGDKMQKVLPVLERSLFPESGSLEPDETNPL
ncbi:MAG TPA: C13 family peptidase [Fluviicoccus sp.]|nr:C13 family peptidase [Fluviicoccus sp.]